MSSNYGIKVTRAGYDTATAADNQLLFSSSFPSLLILTTGTLTNGSSYSHGLGYAPVFSFQVYGALDTEFSDNQVTVDSTNITNNSGGTIRYYLFARDIRTSMSGVNIQTVPATQSTVNQDYGFKVSQQGAEVTSAPLAQLVSFSGLSLAGQTVRQVLVHQSGYQDSVGNGSTVTFNHTLGYVPLFFCFARPSGSAAYQALFTDYVVNAGPTVTITFQASVTSSQISITNTEGHAMDVAYLLFKDPF